MGAELLNAPTKTDAEVLEEACPFYLSIGMSLAEYWNGDSTLAQYYRKAYLIKQEQENTLAWLQGLYIYDAVSTALHNALRGFGKGNIPSRDYAKEPYNFKNNEKTEAQKLQEIEKEKEKAAAWMESFVLSKGR